MRKYIERLTTKIPKWLINLPKGDYTLEDIRRKTGTSKNNAFMKLEALGIVKKQQYIKTDKGNYKVNIYHWEGLN